MTVIDEHAAWQIERARVLRQLTIDREAAREQSEYEAARAERQASTEAAMHARQVSGEPVPTVADVLARWRNAPEPPQPRDRAAEYGSERRPALLVDGTDVGQPPVRRSRPSDREPRRLRHPDKYRPWSPS